MSVLLTQRGGGKVPPRTSEEIQIQKAPACLCAGLAEGGGATFCVCAALCATISVLIHYCRLNVLITCNSRFTILMEVAIVMEMRQSCSQRAQTTSTPHPCVTPVCVGILYYTFQHKGGGANASVDSS